MPQSAANQIHIDPFTECAKKNVLLVTLDTTRADCLGCYGNKTVKTPNLDALASQGLRIDNAYTPCPETFPAHSSILTGQYPFTHGVRNNTNYSLGPQNKTLAKLLHDAGWRTAAFVGATILDGKLGLESGVRRISRRYVFGSSKNGIERAVGESKAENVNYDFVKTGSTRFRSRRTIIRRGGSRGCIITMRISPTIRPSAWKSQFATDPYLGEISYVDEALGTIIQQLKARNIYDNTLIVVIGDHGEGRGEHNELYHGLWTYNGTLRVPIIISDPSTGRTAKVITGPASSVDIFRQF